jgi:lambda family phage portal protein
LRGFQAAESTRLLAGWKYDGGFTPAEITAHLETIRARSRQMAKDSPQFKRWLQLCAINIVGEGFSLKSTPHDGQPGTKNWTLDQAAAKFLEYHWWRFCNYRDPKTGLTWCDATGRKTDAEIDRLNIKTRKRDGEFFIHILRGAANPYGIAWRVLRPDWCDHQYNISNTGKGTLIHCGVEMDLNTRRPVAYWFHTTPTNPYATFVTAGRPLIRIPAGDIIHGFTQDDEDQPRGIPEAHAGLVKMKMIELLDVAELTAAREEACSTRSYEADRDASMEAFLDLTSPDNINQAHAVLQDKEPGQGQILPPGWSEKINTPQHPNAQHGPFKAGILKDVASAFGVEYSNFANDWGGVSFSSVRVGTISERDAWIVEQNNHISQCKTPQFLAWLESFLTYSVSGGFPLSKYDKFAEHGFRGRRWMWVDPMKDMNAAKMARDHHWRTDSQIAEDLGGDYDENLEEAARAKESRKDAGLPEPISGNGNQPLPDPKEDENEDEK